MDVQWHDAVGLVGVTLILVTYLALQAGKLASTAVSFSALNALGALLIIVSLTRAFNLSAFVIEVAWLAISLYGLARNAALKARRRP